jgi:phosphoribosylanthranilate isomerase
MTQPDNIAALATLPVDMMGFIFHPASPRCLRLAPEEMPPLPRSIRKVGVFVDADIDTVRRTIEQYRLDGVQLHGSETKEYCRIIKGLYPGVTLIKAFPVSRPHDFPQMKGYTYMCDYFLFDAKTALPGGSGQKFDWELLKTYLHLKPFFLSGGIAPDDVYRVKFLGHRRCYGADVNSCFETAPGVKNIDLLRTFITTLKS